MSEFWEESFKENREMWGFKAADSTVKTKERFLENKVKTVLIPGFGYGRNAKVFMENGMEVEGIEISDTAIQLARTHQITVPIYHGGITSMPFNDKKYDGIYSYALLHLLPTGERQQFIKDCYEQLEDGGLMVFVTISQESPMYAKGKKIAENYFEIMPNLTMYFYNEQAIQKDFAEVGLKKVEKIIEPHKENPDKEPFIFTMITCQKS
ncbi:class I SAM-dependent methyltransferase [Kurthia sibirica]|uniref:SAM-dependent methyltransferase n=1 Tax=Kurthia sibirica TaxID=202750 RepID=A0A2U3ANJ7_9BACL|nr:class I SAM-dependent methyltransferase [Kurthia sibirica]PWI26113.1 SAM-dependent methyltransferase [Kurthia sibirica]GEK33369.1 methyltransferase [Kurthia sibirica]